VNKTTDVLPRIYLARFYCNKCNQAHDEPQPTIYLQKPLFCSNCKRKDFRLVEKESKLRDLQKLEIQEPPELLKEGEYARRIEVWAEGDLTGLLKPGDEVTITGILRLLPPKKGESVYRKFIEANSIELLESWAG